MSVLADLLAECVVTVQALELTELEEENVRVRKLPEVNETLDTLPMVVVAPSNRSRTIAVKDTSGAKEVHEFVDVVIVAQDEKALPASRITLFTGWMEAIEAAFGMPYTSTAAGFVMTRVEPFAWDRAKLAESYFYQGVTVDFWLERAR